MSHAGFLSRDASLWLYCPRFAGDIHKQVPAATQADRLNLIYAVAARIHQKGFVERGFMEEITLEYAEQVVEQLSFEEQRQLMAHVETRLQQTAAQAKPLRSLRGIGQIPAVGELERKPRDLYGIWKGKVPDDFDIDAALYEIRHEWEKEIEEFGL
jgi:hypothetical protein